MKVIVCYYESLMEVLSSSEYCDVFQIKLQLRTIKDSIDNTISNAVISASIVRRLIAEKRYEKLNDYLPETTINYIREHINHDI